MNMGGFEMKKEELRKIISQIQKYNLAEVFESQEHLRQWLSKLNIKQINNFINLNISPNEIKFPLEILVDENLLSCDDYNKRVEALLKLKNGDGCFHLFGELCKPNFLNSLKWYSDIEKLSKADTARYALWVLGKDSFINSPYHDEDLKLIIETHDTNNADDELVSEALAEVAGNIDSIKSPYHQSDMRLIALVGSDSLQMKGSFPESSLNNLAINKVSLNDPYHLENMQILANNSSEFLYKVMTDPIVVSGKNYRKEVEAVFTAKSRLNARALYYYIANPKSKDGISYEDYRYDLWNHIIWSNNIISGNIDPKYLENLDIINQISGEFALYYVSLLMNKDFMNSSNRESDLQTLQKVSNKDIFIDLYKYIIDSISITNPYHKSDVDLLSKAINSEKRKLILSVVLDEQRINNSNRQYDLEYIIKSNIGQVSSKIENAMRYYLFNPKGIVSSEHVVALEALKQGILYKKSQNIFDYLNVLEEQIDNNPIESIEDVPDEKKGGKVFILFKRYKK